MKLLHFFTIALFSSFICNAEAPANVQQLLHAAGKQQAKKIAVAAEKPLIGYFAITRTNEISDADWHKLCMHALVLVLAVRTQESIEMTSECLNKLIQACVDTKAIESTLYFAGVEPNNFSFEEHDFKFMIDQNAIMIRASVNADDVEDAATWQQLKSFAQSIKPDDGLDASLVLFLAILGLSK